jgi:hypothetical protein
MYIVIECWPDAEHAEIVSVPETGWNKTFDTREEAQEEVDDCQNGIIIEI